jgi:hypothetical protein
MYRGTEFGNDLLFEDTAARIKIVINRLETKLKIKRGEPQSKNNTKEIEELEERIYNLKAQAEAIRRQNKKKTNPRNISPKPEKSDPEPEPEPENDSDSDEFDIHFGFRKMNMPPGTKKKSQGWCCGSRPSGQLKKTHKKRKRKQKQTKRRKKKKQTRK